MYEGLEKKPCYDLLLTCEEVDDGLLQPQSRVVMYFWCFRQEADPRMVAFFPFSPIPVPVGVTECT